MLRWQTSTAHGRCGRPPDRRIGRRRRRVAVQGEPCAHRRVGGVQIAMTLYDRDEVGEERGPMPAQAEATAHRPLYGFRDVLRYEAGLVGAALTGALHAAPTLMINGVRRPGTAVAAAGATAASIYRTVRPISAPGSPIMRNRKLIRRLGIHEVPKTRLRMAGHIAGGSLNDAFVAAVTGGLRRYHDKHGVTVGDLHMTMPISIRTAADAMGGNRVTLMRFDVPVAAADPAQRIRIIHQRNGKALKTSTIATRQINSATTYLVILVPPTCELQVAVEHRAQLAALTCKRSHKVNAPPGPTLCFT